MSQVTTKFCAPDGISDSSMYQASIPLAAPVSMDSRLARCILTPPNVTELTVLIVVSSSQPMRSRTILSSPAGAV